MRSIVHRRAPQARSGRVNIAGPARAMTLTRGVSLPVEAAAGRTLLDRSIEWFARHRAFTFVLIVLYVLAVSVLHEHVQSVVFAAMKAFSANLWLTAVGWSFRLAFLLATLILIRRVLSQEGGRAKLGYWVSAVALTFAAVHWLSVNNNEYIHFFQYALLTIPVYALTRSFGQTAVWVTLGGAFDEAWQYGVLHAGWGIPYDCNDVIMNACGAGLGVVWICSMASMRPIARPAGAWIADQLNGAGWRTALLLLMTGLVLLATGWMAIHEPKIGAKPLFSLSRMEPKPFWFFDPTWGPKTFHILHPLEGVLLMAFLFCIYSTLDRHWQSTATPSR